MKILINLIAVVLFVSLVGCSSISYHSDHDPSINFDMYKTYKLYDGKPVEGDALVSYPLVKRRFENSINKALSAKGYQKVEGTDADIIIILHAGLDEKTRLNTYGYGGYGYGRYGYGWGGAGMTTTDVVTYDEATLVIDIADSQKNELAWRGTATGVVGSPPEDQEEAQANADEIVKNILASFPPQK